MIEKKIRFGYLKEEEVNHSTTKVMKTTIINDYEVTSSSVILLASFKRAVICPINTGNELNQYN